MRILWLSNTPSNYKSVTTVYNGGGWVSSAENVISVYEGIDLAIAFSMDGEPFKIVGEYVTYYPIPCQMSKWLRLKRFFLLDMHNTERSICEYYKNKFKRIIDDFKPDVIHVWGTEEYWGLIADVSVVPVVLHIQGLANPCLNAYLPPFVSWREYKRLCLSISYKGLRRFITASRERTKWEIRAFREREIFQRVPNFLGRTKWDRQVAHLLNPNARYFHCDEFLREEFYEISIRNIPQKLTIVTTISSPLYKGVDLLLKTAKLMKDNLGLEFEWLCFGNVEVDVAERITGIKSSDVNVFFKSVASAKVIKHALLNATCYVHTSYIDNSPNSLCEAQMLGVTCLSTNVGGIPSLIENESTGFLFPANDPYQAAYLIEYVFNNKDLNLKIGRQAYEVAIMRHNKKQIVDSLLSIYEKLAKTNCD